MFPTKPANSESLTAAELRTLSGQYRTAIMKSLSNKDADDAERTARLAASAEREEIKALADRKEAEEAQAQALADEIAAEEAAAEEARVAAEAAAAAEAEQAAAEADKPSEDEAPAEGADLATQPKVPTTFGAPSTPAAPGKKGRMTVDALLAADGVDGKDAGQGFESWAELAAACITRSESISPMSETRFAVARLKGDYPKERQLTEDINFNMSKFEPDELTAALCAPATPYYDLACMNTLRRPVFNSLPQFAAPRGKVSIMSSPTLSDITTGVGLWTAANEASTNAVKSACQTITCNSPTEYQLYGVYRCLTVRNLLAMTYPELVEAWLNRLGAAHARLAEQNLLNAMGTAATTINGQALGYGAATTITSTILNYIALYQETQRWDIAGNFEAWLPRWVLYGIKMDLIRRRNTADASMVRVPSDEEVNGILRNAGVNPHWFIDTPTWATAVPAVSTGGNLNRLPANVQILLARPGKYALMDRGELSIGVTGNGIYRDNTSNSRNEFTFFFENFEGVVNTDSCPSHIIDIPVCWSGVQIDDIVINCQGGDETGYQS